MMEYKRKLIDKNKYRESIITVMRCWNISPCLSPEEAKTAVRHLQTALDVLKDEPIIDDYTEIAKKLWTYICIIDDEKGTYEELADAIGLTDDELAFCRRLEH